MTRDDRPDDTRGAEPRHGPSADADTGVGRTQGLAARLPRLDPAVRRDPGRIEPQSTGGRAGDSTTDRPATPGAADRRDTTAVITRRGLLTAGGLLALVGLGSTPATADPQGQVGTNTDPLTGLFTQEVNSGAGAPLVFNTAGVPALTLGVPGTDSTFNQNTAGANVVGGYEDNAVTGGAVGATIGGGGSSGTDTVNNVNRANTNEVSDDYGTVAGGQNNRASGYATVGGGEGNTASGTVATVGGGGVNTASGFGATVGGGGLNTADGQEATVAGGSGNTATGGRHPTVGGGQSNTADGQEATVAGGSSNTAGDLFATVGGGYGNTAGPDAPNDTADSSTVGGGWQNTASLSYATVSGGAENTASRPYATVGGGDRNTASGFSSTVSGGALNTANESFAMVPGGLRGNAVDDYSFVWNDGTRYHDTSDDGNPDGLSSAQDIAGSGVTGPNTFHASATGGFRFITGPNAVTFISGGSTGWATTSTRTAKTAFESVDTGAILDGVARMELSTWEYKDDEGEGRGERHIGPVAEEFHAIVDVGGSDSHINSINADGVLFAAVQALAERLNDREERVDELETELEAKEDRIAELEREIERLGTEFEVETGALRAENEALRERLAAVEDHLDLAGGTDGERPATAD